MWQSLPLFGKLVLDAVMVVAAYTFAVAVVAGRGRPRYLQAARLGAYGTVSLIGARRGPPPGWRGADPPPSDLLNDPPPAEPLHGLRRLHRSLRLRDGRARHRAPRQRVDHRVPQMDALRLASSLDRQRARDAL